MARLASRSDRAECTRPRGPAPIGAVARAREVVDVDGRDRREAHPVARPGDWRRAAAAPRSRAAASPSRSRIGDGGEPFECEGEQARVAAPARDVEARSDAGFGCQSCRRDARLPGRG